MSVNGNSCGGPGEAAIPMGAILIKIDVAVNTRILIGENEKPAGLWTVGSCLACQTQMSKVFLVGENPRHA